MWIIFGRFKESFHNLFPNFIHEGKSTGENWLSASISKVAE